MQGCAGRAEFFALALFGETRVPPSSYILAPNSLYLGFLESPYFGDYPLQEKLCLLRLPGIC
jgi:hypothetical protein